LRDIEIDADFGTLFTVLHETAGKFGLF